MGKHGGIQCGPVVEYLNLTIPTQTVGIAPMWAGLGYSLPLSTSSVPYYFPPPFIIRILVHSSTRLSPNFDLDFNLRFPTISTVDSFTYFAHIDISHPPGCSLLIRPSPLGLPTLWFGTDTNIIWSFDCPLRGIGNEVIVQLPVLICTRAFAFAFLRHLQLV